MIRRRTTRRRALVLLLFSLAIAGGGVLALHRSRPDLLVRHLGPGAEVASPNGIPALGEGIETQPSATPPPPESRFAVIALRPLFSPDRRPPDQPSAPAAETGGAPFPAIVLTGIVRAGADSLAVVEPARPGPATEPPLILRVGDTVSGWTVDEIGSDRIVLLRGGERRELELKEDTSRRRQLRQGQERRTSGPQQNQLRPRTVQPTQPPRNQ